MTDSRRGLILINTGPGKGKTTAAMGTALRAVGNGMKVLMLQFLKGSWHYGELDAVQAFGSNFVLKQMGRGFVKVGGAETDPEDIRMVEAAWAEAREAIYSGEWDMVVLDEMPVIRGIALHRVLDGMGRHRHRRGDVEPAAAGFCQPGTGIGNDDGFTHFFGSPCRAGRWCLAKNCHRT